MEENISKKELSNIVNELYNEFNEEKIRYTTMYEENQRAIEESQKYIEELSENEENDFSIFSPRSIKVNNTEKIEKIKEQLEELKKESESIQEKIKYFEDKVEKLQNLNDFEDDVEEEKEDRSILLLQEMEKKRISRDLHDSTVQNMTHMVHKTELCMRYIDSDPTRAKLELETIHKGIKDIINELRTTIFNLRPMSYDDIGFECAVEQMMEELKRTTDIKILYNVNGNYDKIDDIILVSIIRIIQEATNNAIKYSEAKEIKVTISHNQNEISLVVKDNGKGIDSSKKKDSESFNGFGISIMKERVKILDGHFDIKSDRKTGTQIEVVIPINEKGED